MKKATATFSHFDFLLFSERKQGEKLPSMSFGHVKAEAHVSFGDFSYSMFIYFLRKNP